MAKNGQLDTSTLTVIRPGLRLRNDAAWWFNKMDAAYRERFGVSISVTDAYRTLATQKVLYVVKGPGLAAFPGTSNHGWAMALDLGGGINRFGTPQHNWLVANGPSYGWGHPYWARKGGGREEAWHFEFDGRPIPAAGGGSVTPAPVTPTTPVVIPEIEEEKMFRIRINASPDPKVVGTVYVAQFGPKGHAYFRPIGGGENGLYDKIEVPIYDMSHNEKDQLRERLINAEANWRIV